MSSWRVNEGANFLNELYDEAEELQCEVDISVEDSDDEVEYKQSPASPTETDCSIQSSVHPKSPVESKRDRSRSPVSGGKSDSEPSSSSAIRILDKQPTPPHDDEELPEDNDIIPDMFLVPDAHALYAHRNGSGNVSDEERNVRVKSRSGRRVACRSRTHRVSGKRRRRVGEQHSRPGWLVGHPLEEIWITDDDVPSELRDLARDVVRNRELRAQEIRDRALRNSRDWTVDDEDVSEDEEEFQDAIDGWGKPLLEGQSLIFEWSSMETYQPKEEVFTPERTGPVECRTTPYDAFRTFWDDDLMEHIADQTNQYASKITSSFFQTEWYPTNAHELMCLFAFWVMLGIVRMPTIKSCFSSDPLLRTEIFRKIFTLRRFSILMRVLHFIDTDTYTHAGNPTSGNRFDRLKPIIKKLNANFQANYIPSKDICIDDGMTLWKDKLSNDQSIQCKATKFGIKTFELCESATGYLWSFMVHTEKNTLDSQSEPHASNSSAIVRKMIDPLLNKGYRLLMDSWYNSPRLARFLKRNGTDCVGTLRPCRQDVPVLINLAELKPGQLIARHSGDVCVLSWQDNKRITMISTCHGSATALARVPSKPGPRPISFKPQVVLDYNRSMSGVDLKDQMLEPYLTERERGAMKLFKRLLNVSILNARIIMESSLHCRQDNLNFRLRLVDSILTHHLAHCPVNRSHIAAVSRYSHPCRKLPHIHWPIRVEEAESYALKNRKTRVRCHLCLQEGRKTTKTTFKCEGCNVPLCVENCFKKYHTI